MILEPQDLQTDVDIDFAREDWSKLPLENVGVTDVSDNGIYLLCLDSRANEVLLKWPALGLTLTRRRRSLLPNVFAHDEIVSSVAGDKAVISPGVSQQDTHDKIFCKTGVDHMHDGVLCDIVKYIATSSTCAVQRYAVVARVRGGPPGGSNILHGELFGKKVGHNACWLLLTC